MASASAAASTLSEPPRRTQESRTRTRAPGLPTLPMEKPAASTEPQGSRPALGRESVQVPDDQDFRSFRSECEAEVGWNLTYSKAGVSVWVQAVEMDRTLHKIKVGLPCGICSLHSSRMSLTGVSSSRFRPGAHRGLHVGSESPNISQEEVWPPITHMDHMSYLAHGALTWACLCVWVMARHT